MIRAIYIDAAARQVYEVNLETESVLHIHEHIGAYCDQAQFIPIFNRDILCIDEEGLRHKDKLKGGFMWGNCVYAGNGIIIGKADLDTFTGCSLPLDTAQQWVKFIPVDMLPEPLFYVQVAG